MANWKYTLKASSALRDAINKEDPEAVLNALERAWIEIYHYISDEDIYSNNEFNDDLDDINNERDNLYYYEDYDMTYDDVIDNIDYLCNELYDFCDAERIWIEVNNLSESINESLFDNLKFISMSSEHKDILDKNHGLPFDEARQLLNLTGSRYFTYATLDSPIGKLPIAVSPHNAKQLKFKKYQKPWVVSNPVWEWIAKERTDKQQKFIDDNIEDIDEAFKEYITQIEF